MAWTESSGRPAAQTTGSGEKGGDDLPEAAATQQTLKPLFLYFYKKVDMAAFGARKKSDDIEDCEAMDKEFRMRALANLLREFVCVRVDVNKADPRILRKYRVRRAPTSVLVDLRGRICWAATGDFSWKKVERLFLRHIRAADAMVRRLARGPEGDPTADRARRRLEAIERREAYARAEKLYLRSQFDRAREILAELASAGDDEDFYVRRAAVMVQEIDAARLYFAAEADIKARRYPAAAEKLRKILAGFPRARSFRSFAREKLASIKDELEK